MERRFVISDPEKCLGCFLCEFSCSAFKEKSTDPTLSRIHAINFEPKGSMAVACVLCEDPPCVGSCPVNALRRSEETGIIVVDEYKCIGCSWCIKACPFGAVVFHPGKKVVTICDLCEGDPECVKACPYEGALAFMTVEEISHKGAREAFNKILKEIEGG